MDTNSAFYKEKKTTGKPNYKIWIGKTMPMPYKIIDPLTMKILLIMQFKTLIRTPKTSWQTRNGKSKI